MTKLSINPDDLTLEELEVLEETLGTGIDGAFADGKPKAKAMRVIIWLMKRREDPDFTLEDAGKLRLSDLDLEGEDPGE